MTLRILAALVAMSVLSACQSVPAERKNHCACLWEPMKGLSLGAIT